MLSGMKQKAIVKAGGVIELKTPELSTGTHVEVIVLVEPSEAVTAPRNPTEVAKSLEGLSAEEAESKLRSLIGTWADEEEIEHIFAEIDRERHADFGRAPVTFDE